MHPRRGVCRETFTRDPKNKGETLRRGAALSTAAFKNRLNARREHAAWARLEVVMPHTINVGARSLFVTATAWVFIVLGLMATAWALVQNAQVASLMPGLTAGADRQALPPLTGWLLAYLPWVAAAGLVLSLATLASAIGLLLRLNWARCVFIGVLSVAIAANLAGLWLQHEVVQSVVTSTLTRATIPPQVLDVFGGFVTAARVMAVLVTLGGCAVLAWIIRSLMSPGVRQEFA
jgi:hypothetical protein